MGGVDDVVSMDELKDVRVREVLLKGNSLRMQDGQNQFCDEP